MRIKPAVDKDGAHIARLDFDPYAVGSIDEIIEAWAPFVVAMNSVNRAMGRPDLYPFVIAPAVVEKLRFIHELVRGASASDGRRSASCAEALLTACKAVERGRLRDLTLRDSDRRPAGKPAGTSPPAENRPAPKARGDRPF